MKSSPVITPVLLAPLQPLKEESANDEFKLVPSFSFANMSPVNMVGRALACFPSSRSGDRASYLKKFALTTMGEN